MPRKLEIQVLADTRDLERALGRASRTTQTSFQKISRAAGIAGLALGGGLALAAKAGFDELQEGQKVAAQTTAVIESTGGAANVTAKEVADLSEALMRKSGVDDEVIASGQNMLLTFRNITNEVGKGNDIFDQATKATLDMSVALGKEMPDAALIVGKALNDPIRGLTALRRVGVQFTAAEEEAIKAMVEAGNVAGAQKVILGELTKEFGGSAEAAGKTLPGQLAIARESFSNLAGELVVALLPALTAVAQGITRLARFFSQHTAAAQALAVGLIALTGALLGLSVIGRIIALVRALRVAVLVLNVALLANPVGAVALAVIALGVALVIAYKKSETFRNIVSAAVSFVRQHWQKLLLVLGPFGAAILVIVRHFGTFRTIAVRALGFAAAAARSLSSAISTVVGWMSTLIGWVNSAISAIGRLASAIRNIPRPSLPGVPFIDVPGFQTGGIVPGPRGAPQLVMAHGGETILPTHRSGGATIVVPVYLDGRQIAEAMFDPLRNKAAQFRRGNGKAAF